MLNRPTAHASIKESADDAEPARLTAPRAIAQLTKAGVLDAQKSQTISNSIRAMQGFPSNIRGAVLQQVENLLAVAARGGLAAAKALSQLQSLVAAYAPFLHARPQAVPRGRRHCSDESLDAKWKGWVVQTFGGRALPVLEGDPIYLGLSAQDVSVYVLTCLCRLDELPGPRSKPVKGEEIVRANTVIRWKVAQGKGHFVTKAGGMAYDEVQGENVLYQPPLFKGRHDVRIEAVISHDDRDKNKPPLKKQTATVTFDLVLVRTVTKKRIGTWFTYKGAKHPTDELCGTPGAAKRALSLMRGTLWHLSKKVLGDSLKSVARWIARFGDPIDRGPPRIQMPIWQEKVLVRYSVDPNHSELKEPPDVTIGTGECIPKFTLDPLQMAELTIRSDAVQDLCSRDTVVLKVADDPRLRQMYKQCVGTLCTSTALKQLPLLRDVVEFEWDDGGRGKFLGTPKGRTVVWQVDAPHDTTPVLFEVRAYSILSSKRVQVGKGTENVPVTAKWRSTQAGYIAYIDKGKTGLPEPTTKVPCDGVKCIKKAPPGKVVIGMPGAPHVYYAYIYRRWWTLWEVPKEQYLGELTPYRGLWVPRDKEHPWMWAAQIMKAIGANPAPGRTYRGIHDYERKLKRSKEFKHMGGVNMRALERRGQLVAFEIVSGFCEMGFTVLLGSYTTGERDKRFGKTPLVIVSPLNKEQIRLTMRDRVRLGPGMREQAEVLTNREAFWIPIVMEATLVANSDRATVSASSDDQFPSVVTYKGRGGPRGGPVEGKTTYQIELVDLLNKLPKCIELGEQGL